MAKKKTTKSARKASPGVQHVKVSSKYKAAIEKAQKSPVGANVWKPKEDGEAVAGIIASANWRDGTDKPYCSILLDTGEQVVLLRLGAILVREFAERQIKVGSVVAIAFRGTAPSNFGPGAPAKLFAVEVVSNGKGAVIVTPEQAEEASRRKERKPRAKKT